MKPNSHGFSHFPVEFPIVFPSMDFPWIFPSKKNHLFRPAAKSRSPEVPQAFLALQRPDLTLRLEELQDAFGPSLWAMLGALVVSAWCSVVSGEWLDLMGTATTKGVMFCGFDHGRYHDLSLFRIFSGTNQVRNVMTLSASWFDLTVIS